MSYEFKIGVFEVGTPLVIRMSLSHSDWYTDDIYYVVKYISAGEVYNGEILSNANDLLLVMTISGLELIAHETKFRSVDVAIARDDKIDYLIG